MNLRSVLDRCGLARAAATALVACCLSPFAQAEPVIGQFELKTLESSPGAFEFQSQNAWSWGHPARRVESEGTQLVFDENAVIRQRHALELEAGLTRSLKMRVGVELEKERVDEPEMLERGDAFDELQLAEVGIELIAILVPRHADGAGFGVVAELERPVEGDEPDILIVGPIIEYQSDRWFAAVVPTFVRTLGGRTEEGDDVDEKWDFAYAAQLKYSFSDRWSLAFEGYGTVERLSDSGRPSESAHVFGDFNQHRAGPVLYHTHHFGDSQRGSSKLSDADDPDDDMGLAVGLGLLAGLNQDTSDHTVKLSIELDF